MIDTLQNSLHAEKNQLHLSIKKSNSQQQSPTFVHGPFA